MCFHGASLQCSCPSYRAAEWETLVGPGGAGRGGLLMVDWMVAVGPEAEDQRRQAALCRVSCFYIIPFCWDLTADLFSLTKQIL